MVHLQQRLAISERRACRIIGQPRSTQRKPHLVRDDDAALTAAIIRLASEHGRYGHRHITALLRTDGWRINAKRLSMSSPASAWPSPSPGGSRLMTLGGCIGRRSVDFGD